MDNATGRGGRWPTKMKRSKETKSDAAECKQFVEDTANCGIADTAAVGETGSAPEELGEGKLIAT